VTKAYRTLCDACANARKVCSSCCGDLDAPEEVKEGDMEVESHEESSPSIKRARTTPQMPIDEAPGAMDAISGAVEEPEVQMHVDDFAAPAALPVRDSAPDWDSRKFHTIASSKYSKDRVVGSKSDTVFAFGETPQPEIAGEASNGEETALKPNNDQS
jgi:hypothetical protein